MKDIAIYGAGGYGHEVACLIAAINKEKPTWNLIGFFDDDRAIGEKLYYGPILGGIDTLNSWSNELAIVIAIGTPSVLSKIVNKISNKWIYFPNLIAPDVVHHDRNTVKIGQGNIVFFHSIISCFVELGDFNLLNIDVTLGHNACLGSYNVLNPSVRISGNVTIGNSNFFGLSSAVLQGISIGDNTQVGAGSCVFRKTKDNSLYMGNPAVLKIVPTLK